MKNLTIYLAIIGISVLTFSCEDVVTTGEFEVDNEMMAKVVAGDTIPPAAPVVFEMIANCDRSVTFNWDAVDRANAYKLVSIDKQTGEEVLVADDINGLSYDLADVLEVTEFRLYSKNPKNTSFSYASNVGISGGIPDAPSGLSASVATSKSVKLSWDEMLYAETYEVWRGDVLISDGLSYTFFEDNEAQETLTTYTVKAVSPCGTSEPNLVEGRAGTDVDFPLYVNFETLEPGAPVNSLGFIDDYGGAWDNGEGFTSMDAHEFVTLDNGAQYLAHVQTGPSPGSTWQKARGMGLLFPTVNLEVGASYEISLDVKTPALVSLEIPKGTAVIGDMGGEDVWKHVSYEFTATEVSPTIYISQWYGPGGPRTNCYDNIIIRKL